MAKRRLLINLGMMAMTESLKGNPLFGMCELMDVERSAVARLASLIK
jgi:predicted ribonuclease YlaK